VPRSLNVSQGTTLGGTGRSWSVLVFILDGHFLDAFPAEEDPVPANGNPHPLHNVGHVNVNVDQHWHHDVAGAAQHV